MKSIIGGLIISLTICCSLCLSQPGAGARYVNYEYAGVGPSATLPNGVKHLGGGMIGDIEADPVYGIAQTQKGRLKMLWLEVSTGQNERGVTGWKVLDVLAFPRPLATDYIFFTGDPAIDCKRNGDDIPNLVGVGRIMRRQEIFKPAKLWTADLTTRKFKPLALTGVKCVYSMP